jgi:hypothetical protein
MEKLVLLDPETKDASHPTGDRDDPNSGDEDHPDAGDEPDEQFMGSDVV